MIIKTITKQVSRYTSSDGTIFQVNRVEDNWVHYQNAKTGQSYSCLTEAFLERFFPLAD